ncbi:MAG: carboxypeptidase-like regulatory domain-containing protein, partial [Acidobacteriaceae bacterium]
MKLRNLKIAGGLAFLAICLLVTAVPGALAQAGRGSISGTITDPSGAIVPGARVTLLNPGTGVSLHAVTTAGGLYTFISLNPGVYEVTVSQSGFTTAQRENVTVTVDQTTIVDIALSMGSVSTVVKVNEQTNLIEPSNSTVGQLISADTIDRVPMLNRDVYDLTQLSPGVAPSNGTPNSSNSAQTVNIASGRPGIDVSSYTFNGAVVGSVYFMVDGSPIGIGENNSASIMPAMMIPEDDVDEMRMETQNTPASYQSGGAGVI